MYKLPAQWQTQNFIQLMFPHQNSDWGLYLDEVLEVFENIALTIAKYQLCLVCYSDEDSIKNIKNIKNITLQKVQSNDTWCRDFGGITVLNQENKKVILDFTFNGWGGKFDASYDNQITKTIFPDSKTVNFVLEGGAIDINSKGVLLTRTKTLLNPNRNPSLNKAQIEDILYKYFGLKKIIWLENGDLVGDDTDSHIDMLARFVNDDTIVYQTCDDVADINYKALKNMEEELRKIAKQENFHLVPLPHIEAQYYKEERLPASYVNFLFLNQAVLIPIYNVKNDNMALDIFKSLIPNRDIIGIDCSKIIRQHGSLHCLSMHY